MKFQVRRLIEQLVRDEIGQELIEFAVASGVFLITVFGILEFGQGIWRYNLVSNLAQEGARRAAVCGQSTGLTDDDCNIQTFLNSRAYGMTITVTTIPATLGSSSTVSSGDTVTVRVQHSFTPLTSLIPHTTLNLTSTAKMIVAR